MLGLNLDVSASSVPQSNVNLGAFASNITAAIGGSFTGAETFSGSFSSGVNSAIQSAFVGTETFSASSSSDVTAAIASSFAGSFVNNMGSFSSDVTAAIGSSLTGSNFVPTMLAGCVLWLRADLGITIGTGVSAWADQSGTGDSNKNCTQATGSKQPTRNAVDAAYNNQSTLSFSQATSQGLVSGIWAASQAQPMTVIVVGNTSDNNPHYFVDGIATSNRAAIFQSTTTSINIFGGTQLAETASSLNSPSVLAGVFNGASNSKIFQNNSQTALGSGNAGTETLTGTTIGSQFALSTYMSGKIAEIIIYNSALSSANLQTLFKYCGTRYTISVS